MNVRSSWRSLLEQEGRERLILLANHVLASEEAGWQRLQPHAGRVLRLCAQGWPALLGPFLPQPEPMQVRITPAGLLELCPEAQAASGCDLEVVVDTHDPAGLVARVLSGGMPTLQLRGDAQLAADVNWLAENLRWDVAADLERLFGPVPAERLRLWGLAVTRALREALGRLAARATAR